MSNKIKRDLKAMVDQEVIDQSTANDIANWYSSQQPEKESRLFTIFGVFGATLVGLGIILIVAHNWDMFPRSVKTIWAFIPLCVGLAACFYTILKRPKNAGMNESSAVFTIIGIGTSIALVAQIYNIEGDLASFMLTWSLLALPLVYIMRTNMGAILYLTGITFYLMDTSFGYQNDFALPYLALFAAIVPFYVYRVRNAIMENATSFLHYGMVISTMIALAALGDEREELLFITYPVFMGLLWQIGSTTTFERLSMRANPYRIVGVLGLAIWLVSFSFRDAWKEVTRHDFNTVWHFSQTEMLATLAIGFVLVMVLFMRYKNDSSVLRDPLNYLHLLFIPLLAIAIHSEGLAAILVNIIALVWGVILIFSGIKEDRLGTANLGLLLIASLIISRYFDMDLSFVLRGVLFVAVGAGFFAVNYITIKRRKKVAQS